MAQLNASASAATQFVNVINANNVAQMNTRQYRPLVATDQVAIQASGSIINPAL
jgi:hypothetical protein